MSFFDNLFKPKETVSGEDIVFSDNYANKEVKFYYYVPNKVLLKKEAKHPLLICIPGLGGNGKLFVNMYNRIKKFADDEGFILLAPSFKFDDKNWDNRTSYQYPAVWSGNVLLEMIAKVEALGYSIATFYFFGHSAGAQYALRFPLWKPELCTASAAHAGGGVVIPERFVDVKFYVTVGSKDNLHRITHARSFYWEAQNYKIIVWYKEYNVGHFLSNQQVIDSLNFFKSVIKGEVK